MTRSKKNLTWNTPFFTISQIWKIFSGIQPPASDRHALIYGVVIMVRISKGPHQGHRFVPAFRPNPPNLNSQHRIYVTWRRRQHHSTKWHYSTTKQHGVIPENYVDFIITVAGNRNLYCMWLIEFNVHIIIIILFYYYIIIIIILLFYDYFIIIIIIFIILLSY